MTTGKLIPGIILIVIGILFFFNNKNMGKGMAKFYRKLYTEKNLKVMLRIAGIILIVGGIILVVSIFIYEKLSGLHTPRVNSPIISAK